MQDVTPDSLFFLKPPFYPQKEVFKGQKQPVISPFCNYIKWLLRSDPQRVSSIEKARETINYMYAILQEKRE